LQVILGEESHNVHDMSFVICIARSTPILAPDLLSHASGKSC
jgi:isoleucyl-tRNA synthetase